ncbi:hypothetical protein AGMMS49975_01660 [Clostridia bacterium]|nr:hypothetical protein AGMMS49975_01660 [Clostridia bacterium]
MGEVIIAFSGEEVVRRVYTILDSAGIKVFRACSSKFELFDALAHIDRAVVVTGFKLSGETVSQIYDDVHEHAGRQCGFVAITTPEQRDLIENENILVLTTPVSKYELVRSVGMFGGVVEEAKNILINWYYMSESQAHRYIQKLSMDSGTKLEEVAKTIIESGI